MSFSKTKRDAIKLYILEKISEKAPDYIQKSAAAFETSPNTIYRYLRELEKDGLICRSGRMYSLTDQNDFYQLKLSEMEGTSEDTIFSEYVAPYVSGYEKNVFQIWYYCFSEMMNNVIDHANAENTFIYISRNYAATTVVLSDDGIGIFNKIKDYYRFSSLEDAVTELFKGKLTTDSVHHSGEGIFFSSRMMDVFAAISGGKLFSHTEFNEVMEDLSVFPELNSLESLRQGTTVLMKLSNRTKKTTKEIFDQYADADGGFTRTSIPIRNIFPVYPVSRSQAKRLTNRLESFKEVQLDFEGVEEIGQGFAHELFVVFRREHPGILLIPYHTNATVQRMIAHVEAG